MITIRSFHYTSVIFGVLLPIKKKNFFHFHTKNLVALRSTCYPLALHFYFIFSSYPINLGNGQWSNRLPTCQMLIVASSSVLGYLAQPNYYELEGVK